MKRLLQFILLLLAGVTVSQAIDSPTVIFDSSRMTGLKLTNTPVRYTPLAVIINSNGVYGRFPETFITDSNGMFATNMISRQYRVEILDRRFTEPFTNCIPDTNGTIYATDYICTAATNGLTLAWTRTQSDARYVLKNLGTATNLTVVATSTPSPSAGQILTYGPGGFAVWSNAPAVGGISVAQGTNIITVTNGSVVTVHGTSTGGGSAPDLSVTNAFVKNSGSANVTNVDDFFFYDTDGTASQQTRYLFGDNNGSTYSWEFQVSTNEFLWRSRVGGVAQVPLRLTRGHGVTIGRTGSTVTNLGDLRVGGVAYNANGHAYTTNAGDMTAAVDGAALTNLITTATNGFIPSNAGKGTNNIYYTPLTIDATNFGTLGVSGDTYIGGDLIGPQIRTFNSINQIQWGDGVAALTGFYLQGQATVLNMANDTWRFHATNAGGAWWFNENLGISVPQMEFTVAGNIGIQTNNPQAMLHVGSGGSAIVDGAFTSASLSYSTGGNARDVNGNLYVTNSTGIDAGGGTGEANTASSLGNGTHLFHAKSGVDLQFNTVSNGSGVLMGSNNNVITFSLDWAQTASQTNLSGVSNLLSSVSNLNWVVNDYMTNALNTNRTGWINASNYVQSVSNLQFTINGYFTNAANTNLTGWKNASNYVHSISNVTWTIDSYFTNWTAALSNLAQTKIAINGGGGTNNSFTNATIYGTLSLDELNVGTFTVTNWITTGGPFTNNGSSYLVGPVAASSTVIATNFIPTRRVLFASTNNSAVTNVLLNVTNDAALTIYSTNHLVWTNIQGFNASWSPNFVVSIYPQFTLTNLWPSGNLHGYRVQTNDNSTLWATFTNGNKYILSGNAEGTNLVLTLTRVSQ